MKEEIADFLILGGGVCGLAAATQLGSAAIVLERGEQPGGLVRSHRLGAYWFDEVLHVLYFWDEETARVVQRLMGQTLSACPPEAYCVTPAGTTRYPLQMHLGSLDKEVVVGCLRDLAQATFSPCEPNPPSDFAEALHRANGRGLCDAFLFPYNRKLWKRPLEDLAPSGFQWNIPAPDFDQVVRGALDPDHRYAAYNADGHYPRPPAEANVRGMEVLSRILAQNVSDLRLLQEIVEVDLERRRVVTLHRGEEFVFVYRMACLSTLPLPALLRRTRQTPIALRDRLEELTWNRVEMVRFAVEGPRPQGTGHWRYYSDEAIVFGRLVFMHAFDPLSAPAEGWGLMAETTERAESPKVDGAHLAERCEQDARRTGALRPEHRILDWSATTIDPAYVVFTPTNQATMGEARCFLSQHGVTPLGRFGRWEYSSMAQVMRDGFRWGREQALATGHAGPEIARWRLPGEVQDGA